jgi:hypothetical protein
MKLFKLDNHKISSVSINPFLLEKDIQTLIEKNVKELFDLDFVKSELKVQNFRFDTLCFDKGSNSFVIIEYKKKSDRNQFLKVEVTIRDREGVLHRVDGSDPLFLNGKSGDVGKIRCRFDTLVMNSSKIAFSILLWDSETNELCDWKKDIYLDSQAVPASDGRVYLPHKVEIIS